MFRAQRAVGGGLIVLAWREGGASLPALSWPPASHVTLGQSSHPLSALLRSHEIV